MSDSALLALWSSHQLAAGSTSKSIRERQYVFKGMLKRTGKTLLTVDRHTLIADLGRPNIAASTRSHYKSLMYGFFTWMQEEEFRLDNPAARLPKVRVPKSEPDPVTTEDIEMILGSGIYRRTRMWVLLYSYQGMRAAEIAAVSGSSVDWRNQRILSVEAKGGKEVWRPIHPVVWEHLQTWRTEGWFFPSPTRTGEHVTAANVSNVLSKAFKRAGIPHRPHQMRAWFATEMIAAGTPTIVVAAAMRHSDTQSVEKYVRVGDDAITDALLTLPAVRVPTSLTGPRSRAQRTGARQTRNTPKGRTSNVNEPKTRHLYMPDDRSLCDRRAVPQPSNTPPQEFINAPVCGSCLLILQVLRTQMMLDARTAEAVWPPTVDEAAAALAGTRWATDLRLDKVTNAFSNLDLRDSPTIGFNEEWVEESAASYRARLEREGSVPLEDV
ncbi:tyrosine-type recombinase/integrase [Microbacterium saperdae]|nr:tyrosine-type recombinase/integrase [Microbacterium saperdae]